MSRILVLCPIARDRRELVRIPGPIELLFHDYATLALEDMLIEHRAAAGVNDPAREFDMLVEQFADAGLDAVVSTDDYPGSTLACMLARRLGLPAPDPAVNLLCQHKYQSRVAQRRFAPDATPPFALVDTLGSFVPPSEVALPAFVKPLKSFFSIGAQRIDCWDELEPARERWATLGDFFQPFEQMLAMFTPFTVGTARLILEGLLEGAQVTVEGFAYRGEIEIIGVVDSVMFPDTIVFERFEYPSSLPDAVQDRMADVARRVMAGMGFDSGLFNIEMMYNPVTDAVNIIEINPRMASQFGDLYEKVDGTNTYAVMLDIARGRRPRMQRRRGRHKMAASCVLRKFADQEIWAHPSAQEIEALAADYPDLRVEATGAVGGRLSDVMQDGNSFRYGLIHLGGGDRQDILQALEHCEQSLTFGLRPLGDRPKMPTAALRLAG